eukprot:scaffold62011_cov29-Phaeocystis_antarctica.AAC.1
MHMQRRGALAEGALGRVKDFDLLRFLGKGSFGAVYQARRAADRKTYAIKKRQILGLRRTGRHAAYDDQGAIPDPKP